MIDLEEHLHFRGGRRSRLPINITPLIDVVFLLLIFFMLATSLLEPQAFILQLPEERRDVVSNKANIVVDIAVDGGIKLKGVRVPLDRLTARIGALIAGDPERPVWIRAERQVPVQRTVDVMDRIRAAGSKNIKFVTRVAKP
ncbi:MAG: ExbD/TolR family protein [Candidatus Methylomirabilales bacterium]